MKIALRVCQYQTETLWNLFLCIQSEDSITYNLFFWPIVRSVQCNMRFCYFRSTAFISNFFISDRQHQMRDKKEEQLPLDDRQCSSKQVSWLVLNLFFNSSEFIVKRRDINEEKNLYHFQLELWAILNLHLSIVEMVFKNTVHENQHINNHIRDHN